MQLSDNLVVSFIIGCDVIFNIFKKYTSHVRNVIIELCSDSDIPLLIYVYVVSESDIQPSRL